MTSNRTLPLIPVLTMLLLSACASQSELPQSGSTDIVPQLESVVDSFTQPPAGIARQHNRAVVAIKQQDWQQAMKLLHPLAAEHPKLSGPALNLALIYQQRGEMEQAERWFRQSISANPSNVVACNQYGVFLRRMGRFNDAKEMYLRALDIQENDANTHRNIAVLYDLYLGEQDKALQHFYRYRALLGQDNRTLTNWVADLEHQLALAARNDKP